ncbi:hypothetical protein QR680_003970 [Steinernema hermaphroditum]|uniref:Uncharacterized protein n=1 Tax=Steinernema hermaphroditum TaxID=289476 RepID=A0AA39HM85_9BILA|nr:hypothetical protein QR680_003970 [Steinernema hermaphroditum]
MKVVFATLLLVAAVWLQSGECVRYPRYPLRNEEFILDYDLDNDGHGFKSANSGGRPVDFCRLYPHLCNYRSFKSYCEWQSNGEMWCA